MLAVELFSAQRHVGGEEWGWGLGESLHRLLLLLLTQSPFIVWSAGARTALVCFAFMTLILTSTYTANLAGKDTRGVHAAGLWPAVALQSYPCLPLTASYAFLGC